MTSRTVLITGAAGGIGAATVALFAAAGWHVHATDISTPATHAATHWHPCDLSDADAVQRLAAAVAATTPQLDALVNNAGYQVCKPLIETTPDEWDTVMAVNVRAAYLLTRATYPLLHQHGGAIVNVSSVHAVATSAHIAAYAASKGALLALTRALAIEFAPANIRVNAVLPGAVDTPMLRAGLGRGHAGDGAVTAQLAALAARTVNGRVADPAEIAQTILFFADNTRSSFVTGQSLIVDGGVTARLSSE